MTYEIKPLLDYCINHPYIGDVLLFKLPLQEPPWGDAHLVMILGFKYVSMDMLAMM
jgi:hypothetical protein